MSSSNNVLNRYTFVMNDSSVRYKCSTHVGTEREFPETTNHQRDLWQ